MLWFTQFGGNRFRSETIYVYILQLNRCFNHISSIAAPTPQTKNHNCCFLSWQEFSVSSQAKKSSRLLSNHLYLCISIFYCPPAANGKRIRFYSPWNNSNAFHANWNFPTTAFPMLATWMASYGARFKRAAYMNNVFSPTPKNKN